MNDEPIRETAEQRASRYMDARDAALQEAERLRGLKVMSDLVIEGLHAKVADRNDEVDELTAEVASLRAALQRLADGEFDWSPGHAQRFADSTLRATEVDTLSHD